MPDIESFEISHSPPFRGGRDWLVRDRPLRAWISFLQESVDSDSAGGDPEEGPWTLDDDREIDDEPGAAEGGDAEEGDDEDPTYVEVSVTAEFDHAPRMTWRWNRVPHPHGTILSLPGLGISSPADGDPPTSVRFQVSVRAGAEESEARFPLDGSIELRAPTGSPEAQTRELPSIFTVLQRRATAGGSASSARAVVDHVATRLEHYAHNFDTLFDDPVYAPYPGEIDENGDPATELAPWQKWAIQYVTGAYYSMASRRHLPHLAQGLGYPLVSVCNNLTDMLLRARGITIGGDSGIGLPANHGRPTSQKNTLSRAVGRNRSRGALFDDWSSGGRRSADKLRPGSVILYNENHVNTVLRVRRAGGATYVQMFDTGATTRDADPPPPAILQFRKCLTEQEWTRGVPFVTNSNRAFYHAFIPSQSEGQMPTRPLHRPDSIARDFFLPVAGSPPDASPRAGWFNAGSASDVSTLLRSEVYAPEVYLAVFRRSNGALEFLSQPMRLGVPLTHLVGSVARAPASDTFEARWFVKSAGTWEACWVENQMNGRVDHVAVEVFNDASGIARFYRSRTYAPNDSKVPGVASRLDALYDAREAGTRHDAPSRLVNAVERHAHGSAPNVAPRRLAGSGEINENTEELVRLLRKHEGPEGSCSDCEAERDRRAPRLPWIPPTGSTTHRRNVPDFTRAQYLAMERATRDERRRAGFLV